MKRLCYTLCCLLFLLTTLPLSGQVIGNDRVSSTLSSDTIGLDESATLSITIKGIGDVVDVSTPTIRPNGAQIAPIGNTRQFTSINGVVSNTTTYNFLITPLEKGRFVIDPVSVNVNGVDYTTTSHRLEVTDAMGGNRRNQPSGNAWSNYPGMGSFPSVSRPEPPPQGEDLILEAELEPQTVYEHEAAIYNLRLLAAVRLMRDPHYNPIHPTGLVSVPFPQTNREEVRDGRGYAVTEAKTAFFPLTKGTYEFAPQQIDFAVGYFGQVRRLATESQTLNVLPLPLENQPKSFTGAVGEGFEVQGELSKSSVTAGQTVELRVKAKGAGNLELVPYPHLPNWKGVEKKQSEGSSHVEILNEQVQSQRTYLFRLKFKDPGTYRLDDISLAYFRPSTERYEVVKVPTLTVEVSQAQASSPEESSGGGTLSPEDQPREQPGSRQKTSGRVPGSLIGASLLLGLLGLILGSAGTKGEHRFKLPGWKRSNRRPRTMEELERSLSALAPEPDSIGRATALHERGWSENQVRAYESIRARVLAARYGATDSGPAVVDLIESFNRLSKEVRDR